MIKKEDILADLHTHTIFSVHAYSTLSENIEWLKKLGHYKYIAITDHYTEGNSPLENKNISARLKYCKDRFNPYDLGINVLNGAEFNIGQYPQELTFLSNLDWKLVGLHGWYYDMSRYSLKQVEEEVLFALSLKSIKYTALAHIERELHKIDYGKYGTELTPEIRKFLDTMVEFCKVNNIYMELNESSLVYNDGNAVGRLKYWIRRAKDNGNMISLGTDAHSCYEVGTFDNVIELLNTIEYPKDLILNLDEDKLLYLDR